MNFQTLSNMITTSHPKKPPFHLRAYGRTELAQAYNPHLSPGAAWQKLSLWIHLYPDLTEENHEDFWKRDFGVSKNSTTFAPENRCT